MGLAEDIEGECSPRQGPKCSMVEVLAALDTTDRKAAVAALADTTKPHAGIARALTRNGHKVGAGTIARHRKGECSCDEPR